MNQKFIQLAINNITRYGDTDIFPFPIENLVIFDKQAEVINLVQSMDAIDIKDSLSQNPPINLHSVISSGYTGFRWGTQIDPIWNLYYLSLVLSISEKIENVRIKKEKNTILSYRYMPNDEFLFDRDYGWGSFYKESKSKANEKKYLLMCDISNFYQRVSHHKLDNALSYLKDTGVETKKIMGILSNFSDTYSYGLPIGGEASRILAELSLNAIDQLLYQGETSFCRFVDDFHIFTDTKEEAYGNLVSLSKDLISNHGLSLQKSKTRIMTTEEFLSASDEYKNDARRMMDLSIRFDPYSPTAEEDYDSLKEELNKIDIIGLLNEEIAKSMIHQSLVSKIVKTLHMLDNDNKKGAVLSILENLETLYPVLPVIFISIKKMFDNFDDEFKRHIIDRLVSVYKNNSYIVQTENNLAYMIRILSSYKSDDSIRVLAHIYDNYTNSLVRKDIILIMAKFENHPWISNHIKSFDAMDTWCRRAMIIASFAIGDEGAHWRDHKKGRFSSFEKIVASWASEKKQQNALWSAIQ